MIDSCRAIHSFESVVYVKINNTLLEKLLTYGVFCKIRTASVVQVHIKIFVNNRAVLYSHVIVLCT